MSANSINQSINSLVNFMPVWFIKVTINSSSQISSAYSKRTGWNVHLLISQVRHGINLKFVLEIPLVKGWLLMTPLTRSCDWLTSVQKTVLFYRICLFETKFLITIKNLGRRIIQYQLKLR